MKLQKPAVVVFVLSLLLTLFMALSPHPPYTPLDRFGDKVEHMAAFGALTLLYRIAFPQVDALRLIERLALLGALIEMFQAIPSLHRDCDWRDWVVEIIAVCLVLGLLRWARLLKARLAD